MVGFSADKGRFASISSTIQNVSRQPASFAATAKLEPGQRKTPRRSFLARFKQVRTCTALPPSPSSGFESTTKEDENYLLIAFDRATIRHHTTSDHHRTAGYTASPRRSARAPKNDSLAKMAEFSLTSECHFDDSE